MAFVCLWMMWIFAYMHQMNELFIPTLKDDVQKAILKGDFPA